MHACTSNTETECFFQVLALHDVKSPRIMTQSMHFTQNHAKISGSTLYGGLATRPGCAVNSFAEVHDKYFKDRGDGITYFKNVFTLSVVAVDQVGKPVSATIQTSLQFTESGLAEGQLARKIAIAMLSVATNLTFNVVSPHKSENLSLYASDGPCKDAELSSAAVKIHFFPCSCLIGCPYKEIQFVNSNSLCTHTHTMHAVQNPSVMAVSLPSLRAMFCYWMSGMQN